MEILNIIGKNIVICKIHYDIIDDDDGKFKEELINLSIEHNFLIMEDRKFNDISYIVEKQYSKFNNWVDLVTVHSLVSDDVIKSLSGALIVANMSNNNYDFTERAIEHAENNENNVIGFITQKRISCKNKDIVNMTPGISNNISQDKDQKYRSSSSIDTDIIIVGRAIYNSSDLNETISKF